MTTQEIFDVVVGYKETQSCSPTTSTSTSPASSTASSCGSTKMSRNSRRVASTRKFVPVAYRQPSRKLIVGKRRCQKYSHKMMKNKIMKEQRKKMAESKKRIEMLNKRREELHSGRSEIAILCEEVTMAAREVRETYERQRPLIYQNMILQAIEQQEDSEIGYSYPY